MAMAARVASTSELCPTTTLATSWLTATRSSASEPGSAGGGVIGGSVIGGFSLMSAFCREL